MNALTAQYLITLYWRGPNAYSSGRYLQLKIAAGSKEEATKYASDFATQQYAESYTVEYIH